MKKPLILFLVAYWLIRWNYITKLSSYDPYTDEKNAQKIFPMIDRVDSFKEAIKFINEKKKDPKNKDFKLFRVEERSFE